MKRHTLTTSTREMENEKFKNRKFNNLFASSCVTITTIEHSAVKVIRKIKPIKL